MPSCELKARDVMHRVRFDPFAARAVSTSFPRSDSAHRPGDRQTKPYVGFLLRCYSDPNFWTRIGSSWPHKDGKGFNLKLDLLPLDGSTIVIREIVADDEQQPG